MFFAIAHLPDASIRKLPVLADPLKTIADLYPNVVGGGTHIFVGQIKCVHELTVDVSLELRNSGIADTHRSGPSIAFPVIQCVLGKVLFTRDRENDCSGLLRMGVLGRTIFDPRHEGSSLSFESEAQKSINGKGGIADPGVAVIPVASASNNFRQTRGRRRNNRSSRFEGKKL